MKITVFKNENEYLSRDYDLTNCSINELEKSLINHCESITVEPDHVAVEAIREWLSPHEKHRIKRTSQKMTMREVAIELLDLQGREKEADVKLTKRGFFVNCAGNDILTIKETKAELYNLIEAWHKGPKPEKDYDPGVPMDYEDYRLRVYLLTKQIHFRESSLANGYEKDWENYLQYGTWRDKPVRETN